MVEPPLQAYLRTHPQCEGAIPDRTLSALISAAFAATPALAGDYTWLGGNGSWADGANWTPAGVPGAGDRPVLNAGAATLAADTTIDGLLLGGGTITGPFGLAVTGPSDWTAGSISGAASTTVAGALSITGPTSKELSGGRVLNVGNTTWSGNTAASNNRIVFRSATINNNGVWNDTNAFDALVQSYSGTNAFNNAGTYNKQGNATTTMDVVFNNTGTVNVDAARMRFTGGGTSTGAFAVAAGAVLDFNTGTHNLNAASITGEGTTEISGSSSYNFVNLNGGTLSTPLLLSGGNLQGADHTLAGPVTWTGSEIRGAASTTVAGALSITGPTSKELSGGRVLNVGNTTWSGNTAANNNRIVFRSATINNSGVWNDTNAFDALVQSYSGTNAFNNAGTYNKQGNATTTMDVVFNNTGTVKVDAGTLQVSAAMTNQGTLQVGAGATFVGNAVNFTNAGVFAGNGTIATHAGGDIVNAGRIGPGNSVGLLTLAGDLTQQAAGSIDIELASAASFDRLVVNGDVTLAGTLHVINAGYTPVLGERFAVLSFEQRLGNSTFDALTPQGFGAGVGFDVVYNANDVTLVVASVPEPSTWALLLAGVAALGAYTRRRSPARG